MSNRHFENCNKADERIIEDVNTVGWSVIMIEATDYLPSFAYTIGLWKNYQHPEVISFGLTVKTLHLILNIAGENIKNGTKYHTNTVYSDFFTNGNAQLLEVEPRNIRDYFGYTIWFNDGTAFPAMQLIWADRGNKFPWESGYQKEFIYLQPLLDRNIDFKFREVKNLGIFTTRQWIEENKPILRVVHDNDGDWQFLTGDQLPDDVRLVGLEEMILKDSSLNEIFNLDYGEEAERTVIGGKWERRKYIYL